MRYTHQENAVVTAPGHMADCKKTLHTECIRKYFFPPSSSTWTDTIRHIDIDKNEYLHYLKGHRDTITSLSVDPKMPVIVSSSMDATMRFWDFRADSSYNCIATGPNPVCAIKGDGSTVATVAVTTDEDMYMWSPNSEASRNIRCVGLDVFMYDTRRMEKPSEGMTIAMPQCDLVNVGTDAGQKPDDPEDPVSVQFSNDGETILISTTKNSLYLVNGDFRKGVPVKRFTSPNFVNRGGVLQPAFTPDDNYVLCGSDGDKIYIWDAKSSISLVDWTRCLSIGKGYSSVVACNPAYKMMASAGCALCLWLPFDHI